jgi:pyruvate,water dikinase
MSAQPIVALEAALAPDIYGGKAAGLALALRAKLSVPPGFAIGADALAKLADGHAASGLRERLAESLGALGPVPLAVRSSAVGEDSATASFAGQHATILGPSTQDGVLAALAQVHASAHDQRAASYRRAMGQPASPRIAAVVQRLVVADVAGVMFTREPAGGERVVIEAALGLGESVVAGLVTPDHFELAPDGTVLDQRIGVKALAVRLDPAAGTTHQQPVDDGLALRPCLAPRDLQRLAALAQRVEATLGPGRDIEWALAGGELYLLQSRPITALARSGADQSQSTGTAPAGSSPLPSQEAQ